MKTRNKVIWIVSQYASTPQTGVYNRHYNFANEWAKSGFKVYVISSGVHHFLRKKPILNNKFTEQKIANNFSFIWINLIRYKSSHDKRRVLGWLLFTLNLLKLDKKISTPDVIYYSSPAPFGVLSSYKIAKKYSAKLVFEVRDIWPLTLIELGNYSSNHPFIKLMQWIEDFAYKNSDIVISNLKNAIEHMESRGLDSKKFHWIPNGIYSNEIIDKQFLSEKFLEQIPTDKFIVGYLGTLGLANCIESLILSAEYLKSKKDIIFILVGDGKEKRNLISLAKQKNLNSIYFIDSIPKNQVHAMLKKFDILWLGAKNSKLYKYGIAMNKLYEYFYAAKPIIYAINSGGYNPVTEAKAGVQVEPENAKDIGNAILKLYSLSSSEREKIGQRGYKFVLKNYEIINLSNKLLKIITKE